MFLVKMRTSILLPFALATLLCACSGDSAATFSDPLAAMDAADASKAAGDTDAALAGYDYALQNGDAALQADALTGLFEVHVGAGDEAAATEAFTRLSSEFADSLTIAELERLIDKAVLAKMAGLGDTMLGYAVSAHPEMKDSLAKAMDAIELIKTQGPSADLSGLGYAGD
jgi:hypothetical protein